MSGKSIVLLSAFILLLLYAVWRGMRGRPTQAHLDVVKYMNDAATAADMAPMGVTEGVQPSFPSPDTLAEHDPGAPGSTPLFFGGSIPTQG